jgi:hypothetical protein
MVLVLKSLIAQHVLGVRLTSKSESHKTLLLCKWLILNIRKIKIDPSKKIKISR